MWHELTRGIVMPLHCDSYGHMNVRHYAAFFDDISWRLLAKAGVSLDQLRAQGTGQRGRIAHHRLSPQEMTAGRLLHRWRRRGHPHRRQKHRQRAAPLRE